MTNLIGLKDLQKRLKQLDDKQQRSAFRKALRIRGDELKAEMQSMVPVDSKNLKKSIVNRVSQDRDRMGFKATIGPSKKTGTRKGEQVVTAHGWYAHFVEYGTVKAAAQPYMRPSWEKDKSLLERKLLDELRRQVIRRATGRA